MENIIKGLQLEIVSSTIENIEHDLFEKYKMVGNPAAHKYMRNVAISGTSEFESSEFRSSDNFIYEYMIDDRLIAMIYSRRNDFNTVDLYISEFGDGKELTAEEREQKLHTVVERIGLGDAYKLACHSMTDCNFKDFYSTFEEDAC